MPDFLSIGISDSIVQKLNQNNIKTPTPIQEQTIPFVLEGRDIIAQAQTGTGKTLAFILPILEKIDSNASHVQALIVTPTRELAIQITAEVEKLIADIDNIDVLAVYGGQDVDKQLKKLKKNVQIVVGTPGRLIDHIRRKTIDLSELSFLVLDEADQMLHIGFQYEVETIIRETPDNRQTLLFSATISNDVKRLLNKHLQNPKSIQIEKRQGPAANVEQIAYHTTDRSKQDTIIQLVEEHNPYLAVIFCRTKRRVNKLNTILKTHGFQTDELHGDLSQAKRERVMKQFRDAKLQLLVATDVAARGLDVEGVTHVYNYDIPEDVESYVHRIGRTGRAGSTGLSVTFFTTDDKSMLHDIEKSLNIKITKIVTEAAKKREEDFKNTNRHQGFGSKNYRDQSHSESKNSDKKSMSKHKGRSSNYKGESTVSESSQNRKTPTRFETKIKNPQRKK